MLRGLETFFLEFKKVLTITPILAKNSGEVDE